MQPRPDAILRFAGVQEHTPGHPAPALAQFDLALAPGEWLTLLGPAGAGKTRVLHLAAGLRQPTAGRILLQGTDLARLPSQRRPIGLLAAPTTPARWLTVADAIAATLRARGIAPADRAASVSRALADWRLESLAARHLHALSGSEARRVALAQAVAAEPAVLLLDEPFGAFDPALCDTLAAALAGPRQRGLAVLHATRDPREAMALADRIAVLGQGRLRQLGTPRALYDTPDDAFVARCLGECNALPGRLLECWDDECRIQLDCGPTVLARHTGRIEPGARCIVTIRPEHIALAAIAADALGEDAMPARLIETRFLGDHLRLRLLLGAGEHAAPLLVTRPSGSGALPRPGEPAAIAWQPDHALAFPPEA